MNALFANRDLERLYTDEDGPYKRKFPTQIVDRFFECMDDITAAVDERQLRALKGRRYEKVPSECDGCYSLRLNDQFRLIVIPGRDDQTGEPVLHIRDIVDYH